MVEHRFEYNPINLSDSGLIGVLILCNPASINGNDNTINNIKSKKYEEYLNGIKILYILNLFSFVEKELYNLNNINEKNLFSHEKQNLDYITKFLNEQKFDKIIFACGQHFTQSKIKYRQYAIDQYNKLLNILKNYKDNVYCCGRVGYKEKYPVYLAKKSFAKAKIIYNKLELFFVENIQ